MRSDLSARFITAAPIPAQVQWDLSDTWSEHLAMSEHLDPALWRHLVDTSPTLPGLCDRQLPRTDLEWLLAAKRPAGALTGALVTNLDEVDDALLAGVKLPKSVAAAALTSTRISTEARLDLAAQAGRLHLVDTLFRNAGDAEFDRRVIDVLRAAADWWPTRPSAKASRLSAALIECVAGVHEALCSDPDTVPVELVTALAGSHQVRSHTVGVLADLVARDDVSEYAAAAFVANPLVPVDAAASVAATNDKASEVFSGRRYRHRDRFLDGAVADCDDVDLLTWVMSRGTANDRNETNPYGKPWLLPEAVTAPAFDGVPGWILRDCRYAVDREFMPPLIGARMAAQLGIEEEPTVQPPSEEPRSGAPTTPDLSELRLWSIGDAHVAAAIADRLGDDPARWRLFVEMVPDSTGSIDELCCLVDVCM
jgi:hypothetical protein